MTGYRIRVGRETPVSGAFEWATPGERGKAPQHGASNLRRAAVTGDCELVIESDLVLLDRVAAPAAQHRRLASALRFLVEDRAIPDPERLHVAAAPAEERDTLSVGIIDRNWLRETLRALEGAGLRPHTAYPESLLAEHGARAWTVVWNGERSFARTGDVEGFALGGADTMKGVATTSAGDSGAPVALALALEAARGGGKAPERIVVRTVDDGASLDLRAWSAALGIPVERGPAWRWFDAHPRPALNLLQDEFAPRGLESGWLRKLRRPAMLAAALLVVGSVGIAIDWWAKARERAMLLSEMNAIYRSAFGERATIVDPPLQMRRALTELRQQSGQVGPGDFLVLLRAVSERLPERSRPRIESIQYENSTLTVTLRPQETTQGAALLEELRARLHVDGLEIGVDKAGETAALRVVARAGASR